MSGDAIIEPSRSTPVYGEFDVVVVGGGPAGIMAASAAARAGRSTLLIERYGFLDGAGTAGGLSTFCGPHARTRGEDVRVIRGLADDLAAGIGRDAGGWGRACSLEHRVPFGSYGAPTAHDAATAHDRGGLGCGR